MLDPCTPSINQSAVVKRGSQTSRMPRAESPKSHCSSHQSATGLESQGVVRSHECHRSSHQRAPPRRASRAITLCRGGSVGQLVQDELARLFLPRLIASLSPEVALLPWISSDLSLVCFACCDSSFWTCVLQRV